MFYFLIRFWNHYHDGFNLKNLLCFQISCVWDFSPGHFSVTCVHHAYFTSPGASFLLLRKRLHLRLPNWTQLLLSLVCQRIPVKTLQLEQTAISGRAEEPSFVASHMRLVFSTLEVSRLRSFFKLMTRDQILNFLMNTILNPLPTVFGDFHLLQQHTGLEFWILLCVMF
jgi:hypothetical protein